MHERWHVLSVCLEVSRRQCMKHMVRWCELASPSTSMGYQRSSEYDAHTIHTHMQISSPPIPEMTLGRQADGRGFESLPNGLSTFWQSRVDWRHKDIKRIFLLQLLIYMKKRRKKKDSQLGSTPTCLWLLSKDSPSWALGHHKTMELCPLCGVPSCLGGGRGELVSLDDASRLPKTTNLEKNLHKPPVWLGYENDDDGCIF